MRKMMVAERRKKRVGPDSVTEDSNSWWQTSRDVSFNGGMSDDCRPLKKRKRRGIED